MARSSRKGPYVDERLIKKVRSGVGGKNSPIKTWSRGCAIAPEFVGKYFKVHNGRIFIDVFVTEDMVGTSLESLHQQGLLGGMGK